MESEALTRDPPTGCEIDVAYYLSRGGLDQLFRLWIEVDGNPPRQLYRGYRHCVPLEPGPHRVAIWYGDRVRRGAAEQSFELAEGEIHRLNYQAPFTLFFESTVFVADGRMQGSRAPTSFPTEAWAASAEGRFEDAALLPLRPAFMGGGPYPLEDRERQVRQLRWFRDYQHEPGRNGILGAAALFAVVGSTAWIGRALLVGGDSWLALPLVPVFWFAAVLALALTPKEGAAVRAQKLGATLALIGLVFLSVGGLAEGWGLPSSVERRAESKLEQLMDVNRSHDVVVEAQAQARSGDLSAAVLLLEEARDLAPRNLEARMSLAHGLARVGRSEESLLEVIACFDQHPGIAAMELARRPDLVRAIAHFRSFQSLRTLHPEIDERLTVLGYGEEWEFEPEDWAL
jgi:hypothetical protein